MTSDKVREQLSQLTERQREVLKLRCEGLGYEAIGEKLGITKRTVKKHMGNIYTVFGFRDEEDRLDPRLKAERMKLLYEEYCPGLREGSLAPPPPEPEVPKPVPTSIKRMVDEDEYPLALWEGAAIVPIPRERPPKEERRPLLRRLRAFIVGIVVGMALMGFLGAFYLMLSRSNENGGSISEVSATESELPTPEIVIQTHEVTREVEKLVSQTPGPTQPTLTPIVITQEVLVPITVTSAPITPTSAPSATATPQIALPFEDNFDNGLRSEWRVLQGEPVITQGRLSPAEERLMIQVGDDSISDFTLELDYWLVNLPSRHIDVVVGNELLLYLRKDIMRWFANRNGEWVEVAEEQGGDSSGRMTLIASGNNYQVLINGVVASEIVLGSGTQGPIALIISHDDVFIDNFVIRSD